MNNIDRTKLIRGLFAVFGIIILATVAGKILFKSGETLDVYAENNPELAFAAPAAEEATATPSPEPTKEPEPTPTPSAVSNSNGTPLLSNGAKIDGRYEIADGFYCELISDRLSEHYDPDSKMYLHVMYYDNEGNVKDGELISDASEAESNLKAFLGFYDAKFAIEKVKLLSEYNYDEEAAISDNNTFIDETGALLLNPNPQHSENTDTED